MDSNGNQRKRGGRLNKNASVNEPSSPTNENEVREVSAVAISPTLEEVESSSNAPAASECRRSSRKKIIKFDVRDLLNKNRKTHKIQIEARIDSNAPSTSKAGTNRNTGTVNAATSSAVSEDILSKQKTFLEKAAIFRRYSISQEHKPPPPLPIPPMLGKGNDNKDTGLSATSTTRRLSRTQEFFSNAMIKPKQTTSLIVAQIESNTPSVTSLAKRKSLNRSLETVSKSKQIDVFPAVQQKKRGRPARIKTSTTSVNPTEDTVQTPKKLTPEKAKNWKEYKACLAQQNIQITEVDTKDQKQTKLLLHKEDVKADNESSVKNLQNKSILIVPEQPEDKNVVSKKEHPSSKLQYEKAIQLVEKKKIGQVEQQQSQLGEHECNIDENTIEKTDSSAKKTTTESLSKIKSVHVLEEETEIHLKYPQEISEIDRENSFTERKEPVNKKDNQNELDTVRCNDDEVKTTLCASKEIEKPTSICNNTTSEIVATVDESKEVNNSVEMKSKNEEKMEEESVETVLKEKKDQPSIQSVCVNEMEAKCSSETFLEFDTNKMRKNDNLKSQSAEELKNLTLNPIEHSPNATISEPLIYQPSTPTMNTFSRTSSSSESENASDRSSYSSAPSSGSSSSPSSSSYKSNDNLRVSVKRISLPKSPSTSSQTSTSEELHANVIRKKPPIAKRSKRLQNKSVGKLKDQTTYERTDVITTTEQHKTINSSSSNTETVSSVSLDNKFDIEVNKDFVSDNLKKDNLGENQSDTLTSISPVESDDSTKNDTIEKTIKKPLTAISKRKSRKYRRKNSESNDSESGKQETKDVATKKQQLSKNIEEQFDINIPKLKTDDTTLKHHDQLQKTNFVSDNKSERKEINKNVNFKEQYEFEKSEDKNNQTDFTMSTKNESSTEIKQRHERFEKQSVMLADEIIKNMEKHESLCDTSLDPIYKPVISKETVVDQLAKYELERVEKTSDTEKISTIETVLTVTAKKDDTELFIELENAKIKNKSDDKGAKTLESMHLSKESNKDVNDYEKDVTIQIPTNTQIESPSTSFENVGIQTTEMISKNNILEQENISQAKSKPLSKQNDKTVSEYRLQEHTGTVAETNSRTFYKDKTNFLLDQNVEENIKLMPKRRGRKPRFKNLHGPDIESETDSSTGKQTPINEPKDNIGKSKETDSTTVKQTPTNEVILRKPNDEKLLSKANESKDSISKSKDVESTAGKQTPINKLVLQKSNDDTVLPKTNESQDKTGKSEETIDAQEKKQKQNLTKEEENYISDTKILNITEKTLNENEEKTVNVVKVDDVKEEFATSSNFLSSQIQNVSIETNTLLDILRTVQSNTEAALKAGKTTTPRQTSNKEHKNESVDITNQELEGMQIHDKTLKKDNTESKTKNGNADNARLQFEILPEQDKALEGFKRDDTDLKSKNVNEGNTTQEFDINQQEENSLISVKKDDRESKIENENNAAQVLQIVQEDKPITELKTGVTEINTNSENLENTALELPIKQKDMILEDKNIADNESKPNCPNLCNLESSLALKSSYFSPSRSESASPLIHKNKSKQSPTRSASSSPLTLKKVTRRYERRSRRGDETTHKTLEETFAEIAAQSSKAVLAAKEIDIEETMVDKNLLNVEESQIVADSMKVKETQTNINEFTKVVEEKSANNEIKSLQVVVKPLEDIKEGSNDHESVQTDTKINVIETKSSENVLELKEIIKTTPPKRGRKPKNRSQDVLMSVSKEVESKISTKAQDETFKEVEHKLCGTESDERVKENTAEVQSITKDNDSKVENKYIDESQEGNKCSGNTLNLSKEETSSANAIVEAGHDSKAADYDSKASKKCTQKRDILQEPEEVATETPFATNESSKDNKEDMCTPKQSTKKRDSSQTKSEPKSSAKKLTKKGKNNEEGLTMSQKDETITTPPASKRGRKPKNQQETPPPTTSSKKKTKKDVTGNNKEEDVVENQERSSDLENDYKDTSFDKSLDEKLAKKKRQKKLKEAFEAALADDIEKAKDALNSISTSGSSVFGLTPLNQSPPPAESASSIKDLPIESTKIICASPVEPEEDPDPLKDIEKFIADGVNLLKKDYKLDEDSVGDVITNTTDTTTESSYEKSTELVMKSVINTFETPADTPINTPSVTPPPKSPTSIESSTPDENSGVRRSHRIKLITKTPKALVGRGLVRDKERFSIKDDVETKIHYTMDDHLTDLAEVEAKNAKFLKEMEERLSNFQVIKENEYLCERVISREAKKMICDCFLTQEEEERGELGCGEDCLNRLLMIECGPDCNVKERCTNKRFQKLLCSPCRVFRTEKKGFGIMADIEILPGEFIMEYVGEVIDTEEFEKRRVMYSQDKNRHYYFMALRSDAIIDATIKGNISRFINHSCDPNAETQKWTVNGELRIGFFSRKSIMPGEEITFNYQYQRYGREAQRCYCESANCRGWIGQEPASDEGEQIDDDFESEDDEEEPDTSNLLVQDDDEDSDASVTDPEEVQKQLEMAAAQAEAELAPLQLLDDKDKKEKFTISEGKPVGDSNKLENEEDSKSKFKKLLSKMAEKVAAKQKQNKREQKLQRKKKSKESSADLANKLKFLEDPDIEDEVEFLKECGLKNQSDTLRLSRLMVRAKLVQTRLNLLEILRKGDFPCRRLFLDYHGLRLLHGWMSEDAGNMQIRLSLLQTLETLPIANKTVLTDSKVLQMVRNWCGSNNSISPNEDSSSSNSNSQDVPAQTAAANVEEGSDLIELQKLALKLVTTWEGLPEIFRIPKRERIEQMKEHEREADRQYAANAETSDSTAATDRYRRDRFGRGGLNTFSSTSNNSNRFLKPNNGNPLLRTTNTPPENIKNLSKAQRREMFAAKVARDEAEKRLAEERREFETKCRFFGLDPKKTRPQDVPFCVNPATGQWFSIERKPISTPPSYAHVQVPVKQKSTDPKDYQLPAVCSTLPPQWKFAITPQGKIYYYHVKHRVAQWEPPSDAQLCENEDDDDSESEFTTTAGEDTSDDDEDILIGMDAAQLKAYIDRKVEARRQKRYQRLVDERAISPRREEDRIYNQIEVRKYKENKEKIRKRKEEIRRKRAEALRQSSLNMCTLGSLTETNPSSKSQTESDEELGVLPIQDYLLSSDEEDDIKVEVNSPLIDRIVEGDKIVDELDALTTKRQLKRPLPPHRDLTEPSTSLPPGLNPTIARLEYKKRKLEKKEKRKPKEQDAKYRKTKEKFRCEIAGIIVHYLKPYLKESCSVGRIQSNDDFNHLARKLTHFVMIKELKYCESVGQTLVVTESVKSKSREFIKKYMAKYGDVYNKPTNDPEFKDIPFTL